MVKTLKNAGRQWPLASEQKFLLADVVNGAASAITVAIPSGAIVLRGGLLVETPFNAGATATANIGLSGGNQLADKLDLKTAGFKPLTGTGVRYDVPAELTLRYDATGAAATQGQARLIVEYIVVDRANETEM